MKKLCQDCGEESSTLDIHHVDRNRKNNSDVNIKLLCKRCHGREHGHEGLSAKEVMSPDAYILMTGRQYVGSRISAGFELLEQE